MHQHGFGPGEFARFPAMQVLGWYAVADIQNRFHIRNRRNTTGKLEDIYIGDMLREDNF